MKAGEFIEAIERFFLDIVGTLLPGVAMFLSLSLVTGRPLISFSQLLFNKESDYEWVFVVLVSYIFGHAVTSFGTNIIVRSIDRIHQLLPSGKRSREAKEHTTESLGFIVPKKVLTERLSRDPIFKAFRTFVLTRIPSLSGEVDQVTNLRTWRNLALSIAPEQSALVYRFTFLSLLNLGAATVVITAGVTCLGLMLGHHYFRQISGPSHWWLASLILISPLFLERYYSFNRISFQLPFSTALAKLAFLPTDEGSGKRLRTRPAIPEVVDGSPAVYLAGGLVSNWQSTVMAAVPALVYRNPRSHGLKSRADYTAWDLEAIRRSDWIFAYLEASNPGGFALALEIGYGKALGKFVILVDEKSRGSEEIARYLEMVVHTADASFTTLQEGIAFLQSSSVLS